MYSNPFDVMARHALPLLLLISGITVSGMMLHDRSSMNSIGGSIDTLTYVYEDYTLRSKNIVGSGESADTSYFTASYPVFGDNRVNRFVASVLWGDEATTAEAAARSFIDDFDAFFREDQQPRAWTSELTAKVTELTPSYLGLSIDAYTFSGGAHGYYYTRFAHFDRTENRELTLDDVIPTRFRKEATAVGERYFREQEQLKVDEPLEGNYFFEDGLFHLPDNFALERDSMLFLYNIYEIKPYVYGQTLVRIPYPDIERLLSDRAKRIISEINTQNRF